MSKPPEWRSWIMYEIIEVPKHLLHLAYGMAEPLPEDATSGAVEDEEAKSRYVAAITEGPAAYPTVEALKLPLLTPAKDTDND